MSLKHKVIKLVEGPQTKLENKCYILRLIIINVKKIN